MAKPYALPATNYIILANAYAEAVIRHRFTEREQTILRVLERRGWGWGVATVALDVAQLAADLGLWPKQVEETIAKLLEHGVIYRDGEELGIQADAARWTAPLRKARDRKRSFEKATETANSHLQKSNDHLQNRKRSFANDGPEAANNAGSAEPKESFKEISKDNPPTPRKLYGLAAIASGVDWMDGELEKFLALFGVKRIESLNAIQGQTTIDEAKAFLAMTEEYRAKGWAYFVARQADRDTPPPPKGYTISTLVGYLQDPSKYPAPPAPKVAPMRQKEERPEWLAHLVRNRPTGTTPEFMDALSTAAKYYTLQGFTGVGHNTVLDWAEATTPMEAATRLHHALTVQSNARKKAANG